MQFAVIQCNLQLFMHHLVFRCICGYTMQPVVFHASFRIHSVILCNMRLFYAVCGSSMQLAVFQASRGYSMQLQLIKCILWYI